MSAGLIGRALGTLEILCEVPGGMGVQDLANRRSMPVGSMHRLLVELTELGFVRQKQDTQKYVLTAKLIALGFRSLAMNGIMDFAQPILDDLAQQSRELVRFAVVDGGNRLTWVAKAQGAKSGLRYDPDMGQEPKLACTATGLAWLSTLSDEEALRLVAAQGFGSPDEVGPNAPRTTSDLLQCLNDTRGRGYAVVTDSAAVGTAALAKVVTRPDSGSVLGTVSIAGPSARLSSARIADLVPEMLRAAEELSAACQHIDFF